MATTSVSLPTGEVPSDAANKDEPLSESVIRRNLLRRFWQVAGQFWAGKAGSIAWMLSGSLLLIIFCVVGAAYAMNSWHRALFDGLQSRNTAAVAWLSMIYFVILGVSVTLSVCQVYFRMALQRRWRAWLANQLLERWLANGRYYQLNLISGDHASPEARIAEDVRIATEAPVDFATGVTQALLSAATFIVVLWTIGGALSINIGGWHLEIPGFLVITALLYAVIASGSMVLIGRRFVPNRS